MKNMYMTPLTYENFNGAKKSTKLHFHLTPREFADWMIDNKEEADQLEESFTSMQETMAADPEGEASESQKRSMLRLVRIIAELSYGKPSDDGEHFDKSGIKQFVHSAAYDAFRVFLFEHPNELVTFIGTILNDEVVSEFSNKVQSGSKSLAELEGGKTVKGEVVEKDPKDMSREELEAAFKKKNQR